MKEATRVATFCLLVDLVLSKVLSLPCKEIKNGLCGQGQYVSFNEPNFPACLTCPAGTYMEYTSHMCEHCIALPSSAEIPAHNPASLLYDDGYICAPGFYWQSNTSLEEKGRCKPCSVCGDGEWAARECRREGDTICCPIGKTFDEHKTGPQCEITSAKYGRRLQNSLAVRSSQMETSGHDGKSMDETMTVPDQERADKVDGDTAGDKSYQIPQHDYSKSEEEKRPRMVEFPIWGQFLCAGIAVGIFLFYLGVGIPCNVCGSLDKLRMLKDKMARSNQTQSNDGDSKKQMMTQGPDNDSKKQMMTQGPETAAHV